MNNIKINIKATNTDLTDNLREHVNVKIESITKFMHLLENEEAIFDVEVGKTTTAQQHGKIFRSEINLKYKDQFIRTESVQENLFKAIDDASSEMARRVRKIKERRFDSIKSGAAKIKNLFRRN